MWQMLELQQAQRSVESLLRIFLEEETLARSPQMGKNHYHMTQPHGEHHSQGCGLVAIGSKAVSRKRLSDM